MANFVKVAQTSEIPAGQGKCIELEGKRIAIFNVDGTYYAMDDVCPHQGGPLSDGIVSGYTVVCPLHTWKIDLRTGGVARPATADTCVRTYATRVEAGIVLVDVASPGDRASGAPVPCPAS